MREIWLIQARRRPAVLPALPLAEAIETMRIPRVVGGMGERLAGRHSAQARSCG